MHYAAALGANQRSEQASSYTQEIRGEFYHYCEFLHPAMLTAAP